MKKVFLLALTIMMCSCGKNLPPGSTPDPDPDPEIPEQQDPIPINLSTSISKATDSGFENGDKVGIYTVNYSNGVPGGLASSGNHVDNLLFEFNGVSWKSSKQAYWKDGETHADFYCYYPYTSGISDVFALPFSVRKDQSSTEGYKASELLWGKAENQAPSPDPVNIMTKHMMSNLLINVYPGTGYTEQDLSSEKITVNILGVMTRALLDITSGKVTADGGENDIIPLREDGRWRALIVPQTITDKELIHVTVGENSYILKTSLTFQSNKQHSCNIIVERYGEGINIGIGEWETDDTDFGGTLE